MNWFIELQKRKEDRGLMANLRCILVPRKKHRAWPALNRIGVAINDDVSSFVAGLYATHPEMATTGNFGATCKTIEQQSEGRQSTENKLTPTERRFQHLLASETETERHNRVLRMTLLAKSVGVPVNYQKLITDLKYWNERTRVEWAASFWVPGAATVTEEES